MARWTVVDEGDFIAIARCFHGDYDRDCYLPLSIFYSEHWLLTTRRPANIDGAAGACDEVERSVGLRRERRPSIRIILRAAPSTSLGVIRPRQIRA